MTVPTDITPEARGSPTRPQTPMEAPIEVGRRVPLAAASKTPEGNVSLWGG